MRATGMSKTGIDLWNVRRRLNARWRRYAARFVDRYSLLSFIVGVRVLCGRYDKRFIHPLLYSLARRLLERLQPSSAISRRRFNLQTGSNPERR